MAEGHVWGGASRASSNHPALASANVAPPYPRRGSVFSYLCRRVSFRM
jgi:hypothetical protein